MLALRGGVVVAEPFATPASATVLIDGERIEAVGPVLDIPDNARIIDCTGCTILAGFWNSHVHFFERKWSNAAELPRSELQTQLQESITRFGFTTVFDLSSDFKNTDAIRRRIDSRDVHGPRILTTGEGIVPAGFDFPDVAYALLGQTRVTLPQASNPREARTAAQSLLEKHVDAIKLFASTPSGATLTADTMNAAVSVAHEAGIPAFVHPNSDEDVQRAVDARVDIIAHTTPRSGPWRAPLLDAMRASDAALIPTLALWQYFTRHDRVSVQQQNVENATAQVRAWRERGGTVLFGTDLGAVDPHPGPEYDLMREAGMNFDDILAALTTAPAARFGFGDSGKIAPGFAADVVIVNGDPSQDTRALADVKHVLRSGVLLG